MTDGMIKIALSLFLLAAVVGGVRALAMNFFVSAELQRKAIHISLGLYALTFPWIFDESWQVVLLCTGAAVLMLCLRMFPNLRKSWGGCLHDVKRISWGEIFFAFSVALLFVLKGDQPVYYVLPLLILTLSDAAAALVGTLYARSSFKVADGVKSCEGTAFFFLTSWLLSLVVLLVFSDLSRESVIAVSLIIAIFGALIEATSWHGLDNLLVPVGLMLILQNLAHMPVMPLLGVSAAFISVLLLGLYVARRFRFDLHAVNTVITAAFFFWIVGGWANLAAPLSVFVIHLFLNGRDKKDDLPVVLCIIGTGLFWHVISEILNYNTYYVYNISFACHLIAIVLLHPGLQKMRHVTGAVLIGWMIANIRVFFVAGSDENDLWMSLCALFLLSLFAGFVYLFHRYFQQHRWLKQGLLVLLASACAIPVTL